ncbi:MAG: glycosyltransferase family 4 protein [Gemmatimonadota bacterium]
MKLLIAVPYYHPRSGGLENYAAAVADGLRSRGWEVVVVCGDAEVSTMTSEAFRGYKVWRLPIWRVISNTPVHPGWPAMFRKIIRIEQPDVVNAHTPVPYMADVASWISGKAPVVITYHATTLFKPGKLHMRLLTIAYQAVQSVTLRRSRCIIAVSSHVKASLGDRLDGKIHVIPNAVATVSPACGAAGKGLVFVANLEPSHAWKGLDLILESLAAVRDAGEPAPTLAVVGDGRDRPRYERRVRDLGLEDSVEFFGFLAGPDRDDVVRRAAAQVVYPATANDGMPTAILEAWAQGLPVVAAAIGANIGLVENGKTGILVPPRDPAALGSAIRRILARPREARAMGEAGRRLVEQEYMWPRQVERTDALLRPLAR